MSIGSDDQYLMEENLSFYRLRSSIFDDGGESEFSIGSDHQYLMEENLSFYLRTPIPDRGESELL